MWVSSPSERDPWVDRAKDTFLKLARQRAPAPPLNFLSKSDSIAELTQVELTEHWSSMPGIMIWSVLTGQNLLPLEG